MSTTDRVSEAIFNPKSIVLYGASGDANKANSRPQRYLAKCGYKGQVFPINPNSKEVFGVPTIQAVGEAGTQIDHAFIMVPSRFVEAAIDDCCSAGVQVATIFTAGFAEIGAEGAELQQRLVQKARDAGMRLIGPNCMGVIDTARGVQLTTNAVFDYVDIPVGRVGLISHSGGMLGAIASRGAKIGLHFSKMVSLGNECDLGLGELAGMMIDDERTDCLMLFAEVFRDGAQLAEVARRAHDVGKPIIIYKLGRSEIGRQAAQSHTGAMLSGDEVTSAFLNDLGILRADTLDGFLELPRFVQGHKPPKSRKVAVMTASGGGANMIVDRLGLWGDEVSAPPQPVHDALAAKGITIPDAAVTDMVNNGKNFSAVLDAFLDKHDGDAVLAIVGSGAGRNADEYAQKVLPLRPFGKPVAVYASPLADDLLALFAREGVSAFRTPEACADAIHAYLNWKAPRELDLSVTPEIAAAKGYLDGCGSSQLNEAQSLKLFSILGVDASEIQIVDNANEVKDASQKFAVKILSRDILHKTDAGLVRLNVQGREDVAAAVSEMLEKAKVTHPDAHVEGVLVAPMHKGLIEVILGYREDPEVGPVIVLGVGGVVAELKKSFTVRIAPVDETEARSMINDLVELKVLQGFRNLPKGDIDALASNIAKLSRLAALPGRPVIDAEINPLIVKGEGEGVVAVDGLVVLR